MCAWTAGRQPSFERPGWRGHEGAAADAVGDDHAAALLRTVETQVIPRLLQRHQLGDGPSAGAGLSLVPPLPAPAVATDIDAFARLLLGPAGAAEALVERALAEGQGAAELCLGLLAPAARRLGDWWVEDDVDFAQVTIGTARLQAMLRDLARRLPAEAAQPDRIALLLPAPGERHGFGLAMLRDFFRAAGWDVLPDMPDSPDEVVQLLRQRRVHLVGFSIGHERGLDALACLIGLVRCVGGHPGLKVMVGGPLLVAQPALYRRLGADATATDATQAILVAEGLMRAQELGR